MKIASLITGILIAGTMASGAFAAGNLDNNKVLLDNRGEAVHSLRDRTCVRTNWETINKGDPCAAPKIEEPKSVAAPKMTKARLLKKADRTVTFDFDSAKLDSEAKSQLTNLAAIFKNSDDVQEVHIVGYADPMGSTKYNQKLSEKRSQMVQDYLTSQGYIKTQLADTRGLGETNLKKECSDIKKRAERIECLRPNRRVEVEVKFIDEVITTTN